MNRISETFRRLRSLHKKALIPYITPEFPFKGTTVPLITRLAKAGASIIEVGIPFSDPLADGPTIQHSSDIAIQNGATINRIFAAVREVRSREEVPLVLMGYFNPIFHYGVERFLKDAAESGVDGLIVPDLLPEESAEFRTLSGHYGISNVFLVAPTSSDERIRVIDSVSTDFIYCVSVTGVTGVREDFGGKDFFERFLQRVKTNVSKPFVVGFGISTREHVAEVCKYADGAVIGSALIKHVEHERTVENVAASAAEFLLSLNPDPVLDFPTYGKSERGPKASTQ